MKTDNKTRKQWLARCSFFQKEYPFGPLQEFKNEEGRLHRDNGFAYISPTQCLSYSDGKRHGICVDKFGSITHYFQGVRIPRRFFYEPESVTIDEIFNHPNTEVRWAGMLIVGYDRILESDNVDHIHTEYDEYGDVKRKLFYVRGIVDNSGIIGEEVNEDPNFTVVQVYDGTPLPDGTYKKYYLVTPPDMKTCQEAVAWTFRKSAKEYQPVKET